MKQYRNNYSKYITMLSRRFFTTFKKIQNLKVIQNGEYPSCKDCAFFSVEPRELLTTGKCTKIGNKHLVTGEIFYENAIVNRHSGSCGEEGSDFINNTYPDKDYGKTYPDEDYGYFTR